MILRSISTPSMVKSGVYFKVCEAKVPLPIPRISMVGSAPFTI